MISNLFFTLKQSINRLIKEDFVLAITLAFIIIIIGVLIGYENTRVMPITKIIGNTYTGEPHNYLKYLSNWDGPIYLTIAKNGYDHLYLVNFFPFYPLVVSLVHKIINSLLDSGLLVAWLSLIGAIYFYIKIVKDYFKIKSTEDIIKATLLFILFPSAIFFVATFTESLFALVSLGAIYYAMKNNYKLAGLLTMIATATRVNGVFIVIFIGLILYFNKQKIKDVILSMTIGSLGIISYMSALLIRFHNPIEFIKTQQNHGWLQHSFLNNLVHISTLNLLFLLPVIVSIVYWWKKDKSFSIYSFLYLLIPIIGGQFGGFARYALMVFPVPLMLYDYTKDKQIAYNIILIAFSMGWTYLMIQYVGGYIGG